MDERLQQIRSLLRGQTTLVLATVDSDGRPRSTPLFFLCDAELRLYWFSARTSRHSRNCAGHPQASVAVFRNSRRWQQIRGVQMQGFVAAVRNRNLRLELTGEFSRRFALESSFATVIRRSTLYCFTPEWVRYLDNARGFGYRFETRLPGYCADAQ